MNSQPTPSGSQTPKTAGIEPAHDDGLEFEPEPASSPPPTLAGGDKEPPAVWYVARPGRPQLGPITLVALKKQLVAGTLSPGDLVWKAGMPGWVRAERFLISPLRRLACHRHLPEAASTGTPTYFGI